MNLRLQGKAILITGASRGIGCAIAEEFAQEGAQVAICARGADDLQATAKALSSMGAEVVSVQADVTRLTQVERVVHDTMTSFGQIDVLVNNAGDGSFPRSFDTSDEQWQYSYEVNLLSAVRFARLVVPHMIDDRGRWRPHHKHLSVSGHTMGPKFVDYQTIKAALIGFSKSMSFDLAPHNILVNCVCPGPVRTPLWDRLADSLIGRYGDTREEVYTNFAAQVSPLKRHGHLSEIAGVVAFLASERASFITGSAYDVDGGMTKSTF
jgi:3-oxoacyl-[acyl-carrier protein] reductase